MYRRISYKLTKENIQTDLQAVRQQAFQDAGFEFLASSSDLQTRVRTH